MSGLSGRAIVITRPRQQAEDLAGLIRRAGGTAILFPVLEIRDVEDSRALNNIIDRLDEFDIAIFISPNAVNRAMNFILARREIPAGLQIAALGRGSRKALSQFGITNIVSPEGRFDSEALLAQQLFVDVSGRRVVIFRGEGGRELLGDTLVARGATIEYAECYRRGKPNLDAAPLLKAWARNELDAIVITSSEGLRNLYDMVGKLGQAWLKKTLIVAPHPRITETARGLGLARILLTEAGDEAIVAGISEYFVAQARE